MIFLPLILPIHNSRTHVPYPFAESAGAYLLLFVALAAAMAVQCCAAIVGSVDGTRWERVAQYPTIYRACESWPKTRGDYLVPGWAFGCYAGRWLSQPLSAEHKPPYTRNLSN